MRYVDEALQPGETIRAVTSVSWVGLLPGLFWLVVAILLIIFVAPWSQDSAAITLIGWIAVLAAFVAGAGLLIRYWLRRFTTEIAVTDRRVICKVGFIKRRTFEMHMGKVESVDVAQTILGRMLNYGDITIRGTGETMGTLCMIDHPLQFRSHVTAA
jgi:uncharacterized membrane protein YdbT with pleckstrin-like domain